MRIACGCRPRAGNRKAFFLTTLRLFGCLFFLVGRTRKKTTPKLQYWARMLLCVCSNSIGMRAVCMCACVHGYCLRIWLKKSHGKKTRHTKKIGKDVIACVKLACERVSERTVLCAWVLSLYLKKKKTESFVCCVVVWLLVEIQNRQGCYCVGSISMVCVCVPCACA